MEGSPIRYNKAHFEYPLGAYVIQVGLYTVALFERIELLFLRLAIFGAYTFSSERAILGLVILEQRFSGTDKLNGTSWLFLSCDSETGIISDERTDKHKPAGKHNTTPLTCVGV